MSESSLIQRCARFGWRLTRDGDEWLLLGNGAPARFRSEAGLVDWLEHQEKAVKHSTETEQLEMDLAA